MEASTSTPIANAMPPSDMMFERDSQPVHRDEGHQHRDGQGENCDERGAEMKEEDDNHEADDDRFFEQIALERFDRRIDQIGAIVSRHDLDAGR